MRRPKFYDGQLINAAGSLQILESDVVTAILNRTMDIQTAKGIISGLTVTSPGANTVRIQPGIAYDSNGERIALLVQTDVSCAGQPNNTYVMLNYVASNGTAVAHPVTGVSNNTRRTMSVAVVYGAAIVNPYVAVAKILSIVAGVVTLDNTFVPATWGGRIAPGSIADDRLLASGGVLTHVNSFGDALVTDVNPHGQTPENIGFTDDLTPRIHQQLDHENTVERSGLVASLSVISVNPDASLYYYAIASGAAGNDIRIKHVRAGLSTALSISVSSNDVTVNLATDATGTVISVADDVVAAIVASAAASDLIRVVAGGRGTGVVGTLAFTSLRGGLDLILDPVYGRIRVVPGGPDSLSVGQPEYADAMLIDGVRLTNNLSPSSLTFENAGETTELYEIWAQSDGSVDRTLRAQYAIEQTITGVQIFDIGLTHQVGQFILTFRSGAVPALRWADGPEVVLDLPAEGFRGDRSYYLRSSDDEQITVWVTFAALPTTDQVDSIKVFETDISSTKLHLASANWSGRTGRLGYGQYGGSGFAHDKRNFGSSDYSDFMIPLKTQIARLHYELRKPGWSEGGSTKIGAGLNLTVATGVAWVFGERRQTRTTELTFPASKTLIVYCDASGQIIFRETDPAALGEISTAARVCTVKTGPVDIEHVWDERTILPNLEHLWRLGTSLQYSNVAQQIPRLVVPQGNYGQDTGHFGRTLLLESDAPSGLYKTRFYLTSGFSPRKSTGLEIVTNARWMPQYVGVTNVWVPDNPQYDAARYVFDTVGFKFEFKRRSNFGFLNPYWYDSSTDGPNVWDNKTWEFLPRTSALYCHTTPGLNVKGEAIGIENPGQKDPLTNVLLGKGLCKAWSVIDILAGAVVGALTPIAGFNVTSVAMTTSTTIRLTLASGFTSFIAVVLGVEIDRIDGIALATSYDATTGVSEVLRANISRSGGNVVVDISTTSNLTVSPTTINVFVFGAQAA